MNNSGLVENNQQSYYHLDVYERSPILVLEQWIWITRGHQRAAAGWSFWNLSKQRSWHLHRYHERQMPVQDTLLVVARKKYVQR